MWESTVNPTRCRSVIGIKYEKAKIDFKTKQNGLSDCAAFKMKAKFRTIHTINPDYEIGVRNKHSHRPFGNRSPPQEPVNRPVNDHTGTKLQNHNQNLCNDCPKFGFKKSYQKPLTYIPNVQ